MRPVAGERWVHFKHGTVYKIICIAADSETLTDMVVYQSFSDDKIYVRSLYAFMQQVPDPKYPGITTPRFTKRA